MQLGPASLTSQACFRYNPLNDNHDGGLGSRVEGIVGLTCDDPMFQRMAALVGAAHWLSFYVALVINFKL